MCLQFDPRERFVSTNYSLVKFHYLQDLSIYLDYNVLMNQSLLINLQLSLGCQPHNEMSLIHETPCLVSPMRIIQWSTMIVVDFLSLPMRLVQWCTMIIELHIIYVFGFLTNIWSTNLIRQTFICTTTGFFVTFFIDEYYSPTNIYLLHNKILQLVLVTFVSPRY